MNQVNKTYIKDIKDLFVSYDKSLDNLSDYTDIVWLNKTGKEYNIYDIIENIKIIFKENNIKYTRFEINQTSYSIGHEFLVGWSIQTFIPNTKTLFSVKYFTI
jgi:hypothetical protein